MLLLFVVVSVLSSCESNQSSEKQEAANSNTLTNTIVIPMQITIKSDQLSPYDDKNPKFGFVDGKIISSKIIKSNKLPGLLSAKQDGKKLNIVFRKSEQLGVYNYRIENIERKKTKSTVVLSWNGESIGSVDAGSVEIDVPPIDIFELTNIKIVNTPTQYVEITFSDPVDDAINLNGIVYLTEDQKVKYDVESNKIYIYPNTLQKGDAVLAIKKELRNTAGLNLDKDILKNIYFGQIMPAVKFIDDGVVMPANGQWIINFEAVNLSKVDVIIQKIYADNIKQFLQINNLDGNYDLDRVSQIVHKQLIDLDLVASENDGGWNNYAIDLTNMISKDEKGIYRVQIRFKKEYSLYDCNGVEEAVDDNDNGYGDSNYYESEYYYPPGYRWDKRDDPCSISYFNYDRFVQKNILASNIGLIVKGDVVSGYTVFASDLLTTAAIKGLEIVAYDYQQQPIAKSKTNSSGIATFSLTEEPWLIVADRGNEFSYLKIKGGNSLSYSRFDTKGVSANNGINAFIYGDRGVWRPGDTLFLTMIAMSADSKLPENHPATLKLYNPQSKLIIEKTIQKSINGFYSFVINTSDDDITGVWRAQFNIGGSIFNHRVRIENIKPNRLKIELDFADSVLVPGKNKATVKAKWLHGGIASGLKTEINATLRSSNTIFDKYKQYNFNDIGRYFAPDEVIVLDKELNNSGELNFNVQLPPSKQAPGKLKVTFATRVFEKGGDFSISEENIIYSPFNTYVGIKIPESKNGDSDYLEVDKKHSFSVATVDKDGNPVSVSNLQVEIYKIDWSWWYAHSNGGSPSYIQADYNNLIYSKSIASVKGNASFDFEISYPMWGNYYVKVTDVGSGHSCGSEFYMDWPSWYTREDRSAPGDASLLSLTANKKKYFVGDTVRVSLPTPPNSNMLVSLESGNRIIKTWWQKTTLSESLIEFVADKSMSPNIYASVSVIQPIGINQNDLPARMYGVIPIMVDNPKTILKPVLTVPDKIKPNSNYSIKISEKNNRKMTYTIAIVDDGLLDITNYVTPNPYDLFYAKQALLLRTWDLYDYVMMAFKGNVTRTFAIGGSDNESDTQPKSKKANRFKPVVTFLGPFTLSAGSTVSHDVNMPNYVGSVRVMVVAGNDGAYGKAEKTITVKQPLMVLTTMPRVLAPKERILLPVTVFAMDDKIKSVKVNIKVNTLFSAKITEKQITFDKQGEKTIYFDVNVNDFDGIGTVKAEVIAGKESAFHEVEIQIRNPNPRTYNVENFKVDKGKKLSFTPKFEGMGGSNELFVSVSSMPQINLESRLNFLISYPYNCIEQTTSSAFPQLFLNEMTQLSEKQKNEVENNISSAIKRISNMQLVNGGFSYWPGGVIPSDWGTTYAGHFLLKAKQKGYAISNSLMNNWVFYQKNASNSWSPKYKTNGMVYNDLPQAYRLFTLALAEAPNLGAMNRMLEMKGLHIQAKYQLASAYALVGQKSVAERIINNATYETPVLDYWQQNFGSETSDKAMMVETLFLLGSDDAIPLVMEVAADLRSDKWMSTQTTAFSLNAISLFTQNNKVDDAYSFKYKWNGSWSDKIIPEKPFFETEIDVDKSGNLKVENTGNADVFVSVTTSGIPALGAILSVQKNLKLSVIYKDMDGNILDVSSLKHGVDFYSEVTITNTGKFGNIKNLALSQIFPSGWEIINKRVFDIGAELKSDKANYIDYKDDRVDTFFNLKQGESKKFIVLLNAAYRGRYFLPATQCKDMYNNNIMAILSGGWVDVD